MKRLGERGRRRFRIAAVSVAVLIGATAGGRALLGAANPTGSSSRATAGRGSIPNSTRSSAHIAPTPALSRLGTNTSAQNSSAATSGTTVHAGGSAPSSAPSTTVQPIGPDVVRTATVGLSVGKGVIGRDMSKVADLAGSEGGYVDSSSMSGGTAKTSPLSGNLVVRVPETTFDDVLSQLSTYGKVTSQQMNGQDVTGQLAENAATISVLQQEVNLLQSKLSQTTDINTFLQIEGQLAPIQQQLQQLESQQAVLQNSVALATITVNLSAPGAPVPVPVVHPRTSPAKAAWHYASHNSLVVLDGLAVAAGWALPLLVLGALGWIIVTRVLRRKRPGVSPA